MKKRFLTGAVILFCLGALAFSISSSPILKNRLDKFAPFLDEHGNVFLMYQNLANPYVRYVKIPAGLRKEEVAMIYSKNLTWDNEDMKSFLGTNGYPNLEGHYFPSTYVLAANADGQSVKDEMVGKFNENIDKMGILNIDTVLKIASLIQREANGPNDMNLISGIIWNRIWNGMSLDIDASLQYVKGNDQEGWWTQVRSEDKKIESPYNTYLNKGLPPSPIANPGPDALEAAYNPAKTNCLFYLHDKDRNIHCSETYAEHQALVEQYLR